MLEMLAVLLVFQLAGEFIVLAMGIPVAGPVVGMVLLFVALVLRGQVPENLLKLAHGLLDQLSLLFVPAGVGVMTHLGLLGQQWVPLALSLVISTLMTLAVTGWVMQKLARQNDQQSIPPEDAP